MAPVGHSTELVVAQENLRLRLVLYRKHVAHHTRRNFQLDLFTPNDGRVPLAPGGRPLLSLPSARS